MTTPHIFADDNLPAERSKLENLIQQILDTAKNLGAHSAAAGVTLDYGLSVSARMGDIETVELQRDRGLGVTVYFEHADGLRKGNASTADFSENAINSSVQAACDIARYAAPDACAGLADADKMAQHFPELDLFHPWSITTEQAIEKAIATEAAALAVDPQITNSEGASVDTHQGLHVLGNSHGFIGTRLSTSHNLQCSVIAGSGDAMQRDYWYSSSRLAEHLQSPADVGQEAGKRALARLGARKIKTCSAPVLFAPPLARGLIGHLLGAISGGALYRQSSYLIDRVNTAVLAPNITLHEAPHLPQGVGSSAFDSEGVATQARTIVDQGILQNYLLSSYSARKLGLHTTGNAGGVHNLIVDPTAGDFAEMLQRLGTGLLVTELMGQGPNTVTGDYSRGAGGFWVENGELAYPVQEITIAGHLDQMYQTIQAVGNDIDTRSNIRCGSILLDNMMIAGE